MPWHPTRSALALAALSVCASCTSCSNSKESVVESPAPSGPTPSSTASGTTSATSKSSDGADGGATTPTKPGPGGKSIYHFTGRFDTRDPAGPRFAWSATRVRTRFSGTGVTIKLRETPRDTATDQLDVAIDGAKPTVLKTTSGVKTYTVATGLADGEHDLVLTKRTEAMVGTLQLLAVESTEKRPLIATDATQTRLIEYIGDSITCGFGVLGTMPCNFSSDTESELSAYGGLAAASLSAEHATLCYSGMGLYRNNLNDTADQMPTRYLRALPDDADSTWNFSYTPDVIVVNLGTNDYGQGDPGTPYRDAMASFTKLLRSKYANAQIVLSVSTEMADAGRTSMTKALKDVVATRTGAGDTKIGFFAFDQELKADGFGCELHPSLTTQQKSADKLATHLRSLMGW